MFAGVVRIKRKSLQGKNCIQYCKL